MKSSYLSSNTILSEKSIGVSESSEELLHLSRMHIRKNEIEFAINTVIKAISIDETNDTLYRHLSSCYITRKEYELAETSILKAISLSQSITNYIFHINILFLLNKNDEANFIIGEQLSKDDLKSRDKDLLLELYKESPKGVSNNLIGDVAIGKNNELFLMSSRHCSIDYLKGDKKATEENVRLFEETINKRQELSNEIGAQFVHLIAPDKHMVLTDYFPIKISYHLGEDIHRRAAAPALYPIEELRSISYAKSAYRKTDSHWNSYGNIEIACLIAKHFGVDSALVNQGRKDLISCLTKIEKEYSGDLGSKLDGKNVEELALLKPSWTIKTAKNSVSGNDGLLCLLNSESVHSKGRLVIFGDSFIFQSLDALSYFFKEILCCRTRNYHDEIVKMAMPDFVLTENVERYLSDSVDDSRTLPFFLMPFSKGKKVSIERSDAMVISEFFMSSRDFNS